MRRAREQSRASKMEEAANEIVRLEDEGFGYFEGALTNVFGSDIFDNEKQKIVKLNKEIEVLAAMSFDEVEAENPAKVQQDAQNRTITENIQKSKMELVLPPGFGMRQIEGGQSMGRYNPAVLSSTVGQ